MPFKSQIQMRAAFGGHLGSEMKSKAKEWASKTPSMSSLPERVANRQSAQGALNRASRPQRPTRPARIPRQPRTDMGGQLKALKSRL